MARSILFLLASCLFFNANCQADKDSNFELVVASGVKSYALPLLEKEVQKQKSLDAIKKIIRKRIADPGSRVLVTFTRNDDYWRWDRTLKTEKDGEVHEWIVFGKRGSDADGITRLSDFEKVFRDTLLLLDSFIVTIYLKDPGIDMTKYSVIFPCHDNTASFNLPFTRQRELILSKNDLPVDCAAAGVINCKLVNSSDSKNVLANFYLMVPDQQQIDFWLEIARGLKRIHPTLTINEIAGYLQSYIATDYGYCNFQQINSWLFKHLK